MNVSLALSCVCLSGLLLPGGRAVDALEFDPDAGSKVTKTFRETTTLALEELTFVLNGEEQEVPEQTIDVEHVRELVFADEYLQAAGGRAQALRRAFREIGGTERIDFARGTAEQTVRAALTSDLEGLAVTFAWDAADRSYDVEFVEEDEGADPRLLRGLWEDTDLRRLLPEGAVEVGGSWTVDPDALAPVLRPGGLVHVTFEEGSIEISEDGDETLEPLAQLFFLSAGQSVDALDGALEGEVEARYVGTEDGIAVIELDVDVRATRDVRAALATLAREMGSGDAQLLAMDEVEASYALRGTGELRWDRTANRAAGFELAGDVEASLAASASMEVAAGESTTAFTLSFTGRTELVLAVE